MIDVRTWRIPGRVSLLGEHVDGGSLAITIDRGFVVKVRGRDDGAVNTWLDGQRAPLPAGIVDSLGLDPASGGADVVVELEPAEPPLGEPIGPDSALAIVLVATGVSAPPERCQECERAAESLGLEQLSDAGPDAVLRLDDLVLKARTRHVITETARLRGAARAVESGDWEQLGTMLTASHASLRDDFEVTCAELDVAAEAAVEAGAWGARASGSTVVALVPDHRVPIVRDFVRRRFGEAGWSVPPVFAVPVSGARLGP